MVPLCIAISDPHCVILYYLRKQLRDRFTSQVLHENILQINETFMNSGSPHQWIEFLMPTVARSSELRTFDNNSQMILDESKFDQLMQETRAVLSR